MGVALRQSCATCARVGLFRSHGVHSFHSCHPNILMETVLEEFTEAVMEISDDIFMGKRQAMATLLEDNRISPDWKPEPAQILGFKFSFKSASCVPSWLLPQESICMQ